MSEQPILVDDSKFLHLHRRPSFTAYLRSLWGRRHFIWADARGRSFETDRDYYLGKFWLVASPLLDAAMYGVIFGLLLRTSRGIENYIGYLVIGVIFFSFLTKYMTSGATLIKSSKNMITAFQFPRASLVMSQSIRMVLDSTVPALVAIIAALLAQISTPPTFAILWVIPVFALLHIFGTGLMFFVARLCFQIPDLQALVRIFQRGWFYISGVFFSIERFATQPLVQDVMTANPAYMFLSAVRNAVLYGTGPGLGDFFILVAVSFGTFGLGMIYFWRGEEKYGAVQ
ncbi:ABC transporter permease [Flaviflexus sp.]|uniref:ABC transporter permease n=1 Tax=Flaviflexus sp. TaxID=1969482 RepID=UPI003F903F11